MKRPLAVFTPLPPSKSGIADYCQELLPYLSRDWDLSVIVDDHAPAPSVGTTPYGVFRLSEWTGEGERAQRTPRLYHLGNNPDHAFVRRELHRCPGITVLHDFVQHHLIANMTLALDDYPAYEQAMFYNHGKVGRQMALQRKEGRFTEYQQFLLPMNRSVLDQSLGVIVHSASSKSLIGQTHAQLPTHHIPHHLGPLPPGFVQDSRDEARARLNLKPGEFIIASLGFITPPKQIEQVLRAIGRVRHRLPPFRYILVGEEHSTYDIRSIVGECGLEDVVQITGYTDLVRFHDYIQASDLIVNLRYPSAGETSGTLVRAMGMGKPAIVYDYGTFRDYPSDAAMKIPLDLADTGPLETAILRASNDPDWLASYARQAEGYIKEEHAIEKTAHQYSRAIAQIVDNESHARRVHSFIPSQLGDRWSCVGEARATELIAKALTRLPSDYYAVHRQRHIQTLAHVPVGEPGLSVMEWGSMELTLPILRHELGYGRVIGSNFDAAKPIGAHTERIRSYWGDEDYEVLNFNFERHECPLEPRTIDLAICGEVIEHMATDPMFLLSQINRTLKFGGHLILTTPNLASARALNAVLHGYSPMLYGMYTRSYSTNRHNIEYDVHQLRDLLTSAGFEIVTLTSLDSWGPKPAAAMKLLRQHRFTEHMRGDNLLAVAYKASEVIDPFPKTVYC